MPLFDKNGQIIGVAGISTDISELKKAKEQAEAANIAKTEFIVSDTGIGIPKEAQAQVFNRYFKVASSYKELYEGHGLGLHIAQSYVKLLGGRIRLNSTVGIGSTFHFDIICTLSEPPSDLAKISHCLLLLFKQQCRHCICYSSKTIWWH